MSLPAVCKSLPCDPSLKQTALDWLKRRGVTMEDIGQLVLEAQQKYIPDLTLATCLDSVEHVLDKREAQNAIFTGITLDEAAERGLVNAPLAAMVSDDDGLYGIDEILALSIVNVYGSIGLTNFGYIDKVKPGIVGVLNSRKVNTFLDDIIAAIAAAAAARVAHRERDGLLVQLDK